MMRKLFLVGLALFLFLLPAMAEIRLGLAPAVEPLGPGETLTVHLIALNISEDTVFFEAPATLPATIYVGREQASLALRRVNESPGRLESGDSVRIAYQMDVPEAISGNVLLETEAPDGDVLRTVFVVRQPSVVAASGGAPSTVDDVTIEDDGFQRTFVDRFALHEPIYLVYGNEDLGAKFQVSFKYRIFGFDSRWTYPPLHSLQAAYTQRSLWDIDSASSPFYDTSYMPSLFYEFKRPRSHASGNWLQWWGLQSGILHESNGQGGNESRSLNTLFARSTWSLGSLDGWHLLVTPEVSAFVGGISNNEQIRDYRGYAQLRAVLGLANGPALAYTGRAGRHFDRWTTQLDLTFPVNVGFVDFGTYLLIQYFDGYGENLLDYDVRTRSLRFGISLVR